MTRAAAEATAAFAAGAPAESHFYRRYAGLTLSTLGIGTYLGDPDDATDARFTQCVAEAVRAGVNVIDTAKNYRYQRSERAVGEALRRLAGQGVAREALLLCTKGGYLSFDGAAPDDPRAWFRATYVETGVAGFADLTQGAHCMTPRFLAHEIGRSLANLGVDCIDVYYLHNPETQLREVNRAEFLRRLRAAFAQLEGEVAAGRIASYGVATWHAFRVDADLGPYHDLAQLVALAREVGGEGHHFGWVQLPYNLGMTEAMTLPSQAGEKTVLEAAADLGLAVVTSASLMQSHALHDVGHRLVAKMGVATAAQAALQFARSAPGVLTSLVGMSDPAHVADNLGLAGVPPVEPAAYGSLF